jgi:hypothetical protein
MTQAKLHELLEQVRAEIEGAKSVDEKSLELLRALDGDIHDLIHAEGERVQVQSTLAARLEDSIAKLEATHPTLTALLDDLLTALSNAGI